MRFAAAVCCLGTMLAAVGSFLVGHALAGDGNRLVFLDESDPFYVSRSFPKLVTPQWVGEEGVQAVVILAIDDMKEKADKWETFLRPILERLKKIDGRAPVSIMTNKIDPREPQLQDWLKEGLSLEVHTYDHPCPLLRKGDFAAAKASYDNCVDQMDAVPGNRAVAFRMPCCDSMNSPSPRFFAEIFNRRSPQGNFLSIDSSVCNIITANDAELPRELVLDAEGREIFRRYVPFKSFVTTIEDYPYPYVIGRLCWEFPCVVPSDWSAQKLQKPYHPQTVADFKRAIDATVVKQGVFTLIFHPHNWIRSEQIIEIIDHAVKQHGKKVKFLTFREAQERIDKNLLAGQPLRAADGGDNGVRLVDLNNDGYQDVVIGNSRLRQTRLWSPKVHKWIAGDFPTSLGADATGDVAARFGVVSEDGNASILVRNGTTEGAWQFDGQSWVAQPTLLAGLSIDGNPIFTSRDGRDEGVRLRDIDGDGRTECIVGNSRQPAVYEFKPEQGWSKLPFALPAGTAIVNDQGRDAGLRFVDVDQDGYDDLLFSDDAAFSAHRYESRDRGWSQTLTSGKRGDAGEIPMISRGVPTTAHGSAAKPCGCKTKTPTSCPTWSIASRLTICSRTCCSPGRSRPRLRWR